MSARIRPDLETLRHLYETERLTTREIGAQFGASKTSVLRWLVYYDIPIRASGGHGNSLAYQGKEPPTREMLYHWVHIEHKSFPEIAKPYGVSEKAVSNWLTMHQIEHPTIWETRRKGVEVIYPTQDELRKMYLEDGWTLAQIADIYQVSQVPIARLCKEFGMPMRPGGFNGGVRFTCTDGHLVRSTYEQQVDNWLYEHGVEHEYEPVLPFDRHYHADFLANGWYIEVWGVKGSTAYAQRKAHKISLYNAHRIPLIQLTTDSFTNRRKDSWKKHLMPCLTPKNSQSPLKQLKMDL